MTTYNFDKITNRKGTNCLKYDYAVERGKPADVLPLWVADMDFTVSDEITKSLYAAVDHGIYGYTQPKDAYYNAITNWMEKNHNWKTKREWIVKTPGVVFALGAAVKAFTEPGDAVLIQNPVYYPFTNIIRDNDRKVIDNTLVYEKEAVAGKPQYSIDYEDFERKIEQEKIKLFILCNPHNPVGRVWTREELQQLGEICLRHHVIVVSDEIHNDFVYPGFEHTVFANVDPRFAEFTVTCTAPSKTFNLAGLAFSNIIIRDAALRARFKERDKLFGAVNPMSLTAAKAAYELGGPWHEALKEYLDGNFAFVKEFLTRELPEAVMYIPEATYLAWVDLGKCLPEDTDLPDFFANKAGVLLEGGNGLFVGNAAGYVRLNLAMPRSIIETGLTRMVEAIRKERE